MREPMCTVDKHPPHPTRSITIIDDAAGEVYGADADSDSSVCDGKTDLGWGPLVAKLESISR